jgi:hypothetical protein
LAEKNNMTDKKFLNSDEVSEIIAKLGLEFAVVHNPAPLYPEIELYPLAPKITAPQKELSAVLMDLEGTVCSTLDLRLHALENTVRSISGRLTKDEWKGLDPLIDHPNLTGIGTPEQIRYLIQRYHNFIKPEAMKEAYLHSVLWTIISGHNEERKDESRYSLEQVGLGEMLKDSKLQELMLQKEFNKFNSNLIRNYFLHKYGSLLSIKNFEEAVRAATEIFFQNYHQMLELVKYGEGSNLAEEVSGQSELPLIRPLPSIPVLFALVKGWLGEDISYLFDEMREELKQKSSQVYRISSQEEAREKLVKLGKFLETHPLKLALVTSSGGYEADIILVELFNVISHEIRKWKIPQAKKEMLLEKFSDYKNVVDVFITADKVSRIRPKPHRDLFSIALSRLGIPHSTFSRILGFEDSENGIIALRASGIGLTAAVPATRNSRHDLSAASFILQGGITEALLNYNLFISL